jgi:DMSO reductase anchor subunit
MRPAYSIIFFTSASGAGYGLLVWLACAHLAGITPGNLVSLVTGLAALALITGGLLSSTAHLGHPERAWRAFSQWRSSWLSREGVLAMLTYLPAVVLVAGMSLPDAVPAVPQSIAIVTIVFSAATVASTAMIYASLRPIPRWSNGYVLPLYLLYAVTSGGLLLNLALSIGGVQWPPLRPAVLCLLVLTWGVKWLYWRFIDRQQIASTTATATGLTGLGEVRQLEAPHTSDNYLLHEMGYAVARKHATRLRRMAVLLGFGAPAVALAATLAVGANVLSVAVEAIGVTAGLAGIVIERWLFFAEARHLVTLYYDRGAATGARP